MLIGTLGILCSEACGYEDVLWYFMTCRFMGTGTDVSDELQTIFRTEK